MRNPWRDPIPTLILVLMMLAPAVVLMAASPDTPPPIPTAGLYTPGIGRCVALYEGDVLLGITINRTEDMVRANKNRDGYAISTYNAVTRLAQEIGRPDIASAAVDLRMTWGRPDALSADSMVCYCENTVWWNRQIVGCGGACGSCTHCYVKPTIK